MGDSKQVKVDNWGIFFLQRLQTFFNRTYFCDLTLQFEDNVQLKVHRLVMNACTEYFQVLEQTCEVINDCLIMPPDLQADVVVPIVNFMYTGILEFQTSIFDRLYTTARLMNMTVLTKLLDAQKVPISPIPKPMNKRINTPVTWNLQGKKIAPKTMDPDLPETLPGRKLPIWKRKSVPSVQYRSDFMLSDPLCTKGFKPTNDEPPKPTRFEWPEDDDTNFETNSFDEISYTSKPIIIPQREKSPKPSTSSNNFEELKRTSVAVKRPASPACNDSKKVNIQDVKEYIKEQKLRSDYIEYDDSEAADNDLQTYDNGNDTDEEIDQNAEDSPNKSILKNEASTSHNKRVRFSLEGKENAAKLAQKTTTVKSVDMTNHTKIITEVLKKYPHLVKKNKNIKLKILAKGANITTSGKSIGTPVKITKPSTTTKISYMVKKPSDTVITEVKDTKKDGHWSCHKCSNPNPLHFETYYLYRKHLTDVHNEKSDSQMCNICGHISRKQNMLMHHKLVKHNITPPPSYDFPKCKECSYIALTSAMLVKHQFIHTHQNLLCAECNSSFATKSALISHIQLTGHTDKNNCPTHDCTYCTKKFISDETLLQHIRNNHKEEARKDNIMSPIEDEESEIRKNIITAEEIDALDEEILPETSQSSEKIPPIPEKPKEKIKIISDVKVTTKNNKIQALKVTESQPEATQQLEPSSEAESFSNVASGIAASLGLVNTIVVLDDDRFILPDNINNIENLVTQQQVVTTDASTIISQAALGKNNITSTDELVMVLTDHDYSDASNNTVITSENSNIVVLYSHPVQNQDGQFISPSSNIMINSDIGLVEVGNNYAVTNSVPIEDKSCEESIELIQQEINNHIEVDSQEQEKIIEEIVPEFEGGKEDNIENEVKIPNEFIPEPEPERMEIDQNTEIDQEIVENQQTKHHEINENQQEIIEHQKNENQQKIEHQLDENQQKTEDQLNENQQKEYHQSENQQIVETEQPQTTEIEKENQNVMDQGTVENQQASVIVHPVEETQDIQESEDTYNDENHFEEPMEIEESIEMIQQEIHRSSDLQEPKLVEFSEDIPPNKEKITSTGEELPVIQEETESQVEEVEIQKTNEQFLKESTEETTEVLQNKQTFDDQQNIEEIERMEVDSAKIVQDNEEIENFETKTSTLEKKVESEINPLFPEAGTSNLEEPEPEMNSFSEASTSNLEEPEPEMNTSFPEASTSNLEETESGVDQSFCESASSNIENPESEINASFSELASSNIEKSESKSNASFSGSTSSNIEKPESEFNTLFHKSAASSIDKTGLEDSPSSSESATCNEEKLETEINESISEIAKSNSEPENSGTDLQENSGNNTPSEIEAKSEQVEESIEHTRQEAQAVDDPENDEEPSEKIEPKELSCTVEKDESKKVKHQSTTKEKLRAEELKRKCTAPNNDESVKKSKISNLLDEWDDGDTDSQQSDTLKPAMVDSRKVVNNLINDWEDDEES